jgi:hypothetical protein
MRRSPTLPARPLAFKNRAEDDLEVRDGLHVDFRSNKTACHADLDEHYEAVFRAFE